MGAGVNLCECKGNARAEALRVRPELRSLRAAELRRPRVLHVVLASIETAVVSAHHAAGASPGLPTDGPLRAETGVGFCRHLWSWSPTRTHVSPFFSQSFGFRWSTNWKPFTPESPLISTLIFLRERFGGSCYN